MFGLENLSPTHPLAVRASAFEEFLEKCGSSHCPSLFNRALPRLLLFDFG